ncbi:MAG TPA: ferritin-like domain-containing protein [Actinomycetota bacterium]|nr:ferritin-like domain-containing protein [Actinomycetota bacterium]
MSDALQAALAGQYAAIYAYGRAGGRLLNDQARALARSDEHRVDRDQLREWLVADGQQPQPPAPAYQLPGPVRTPAQARELLATVELRLIPVLTELVADQLDQPRRRRWAIRQIRRAALAGQSWGATGQAFPWPDGLTPPA